MEGEKEKTFKKYPKIGDITKLRKDFSSRRCSVCKEIAQYRVTVRNSCFRGDDDVFYRCENCKEVL